MMSGMQADLLPKVQRILDEQIEMLNSIISLQLGESLQVLETGVAGGLIEIHRKWRDVRSLVFALDAGLLCRLLHFPHCLATPLAGSERQDSLAT